VLSVARPTSSRSRGKHCGDGSEVARGPFPRADREGSSARGRRARTPSEQERAVSETEAAPVSVRGPVVDPVDRLIVDVTLRCRTDEAITLVEQAIATQDIEAGSLTLGTDNGSAFTSRRFKTTLTELGVTHRRGGYRDPESQAFIESWFGRLNSDSSGAAEFDTLDDARAAIGGYVDSYHHRPHSGLRYRTPTQVRQTWKDGQRLLKTAA